MSKFPRIKSAFQENFNLVGLAGAVAATAALLNPAPFIAGIIAEAAYLLFIPDTQWYTARLERLEKANEEKGRIEFKARTLPTLSPGLRERYAHLESTYQEILAQREQGRDWFEEAFKKLDYLQEKFLLFGAKQGQFQAYLENLRADIQRDTRPESFNPPGMKRGTPPPPRDGQPKDRSERWTQAAVDDISAYYQQEMEGLTDSLEKETDEMTRSVLQKRIDVIARRHEFVTRIGKILTNLNHQLRLVEETFGLINDELRARSPEQILSDVDEVVTATNSMSQTLDEFADAERMIARASL